MSTRTLSAADALLATLVKTGKSTFERSPELARRLNEAAEKYPLFRAFRWNPDYESSKQLNKALNLLDLTGMVVGENMPTRFFSLTGQAKTFCESQLSDDLDKESLKAIEAVAETIKDLA